jgi:hypothetical protein
MNSLQHFWKAHRQIADCNLVFLEMLPTLTKKELEKLIEKRPSLWGRFAHYLPQLP